MIEPAMALLTGLDMSTGAGLIALVLIGNIVLGMLVGAAPGAGGINAVVILLPFMFGTLPLAPFGPFCVYWGARFSEALAAALRLRSAAPSLGGRRAATFALTFLALAAVIALVAITPEASPVSSILLYFGPANFAVCYLVVFCGYIALGSRTAFKAATMIAFGLALATIGLDPVTGVLRLKSRVG